MFQLKGTYEWKGLLSHHMKLHFESNLDYQLQAIEAVCDLFRGQEVCRTEFTVTHNAADTQAGLGFEESDLGTGNQLSLPDEEILANLNDVQLRNGLPPSASLDSGDFTVEMETGTGKTYVYLRTIFELNKRYGFTKFVIVVPSVAIKEGVYKSLQITDDHFRALYSGTPFEYFLYDSAKLGQVRNFATSPQIQIMVVTVGAINKKDVNNLYKDSEKTGGEKPIDLIRATRPVLIVDEPQSVDGGLQGRGLRLCVNQEGQRLHGLEVNTLTVIATESYEEFAENLQQEIETDTGIRFGVVEAHQFAAIPVVGTDGQTTALGSEASKNLWEHLKAEGYIDATGRVQDTLREALQDDTLSVPEEFADQREEIAKVLRKFAGRLTIKNADERRSIRPRRAVLQSPEFKALWDRIKHKTTYRVEFDNEALIAQCIQALDDAPPIPRLRLQWRKADIAIGQGGVEATEREGAATVVLDEADVELPDVLTELQDRTQLTRRSIHHILSDSGRLADFKRNPQQFIDLAAQAINRCKRLALVDGVKYQRLGDEYYYAQELFDQEELTGYLKNMISDTEKSVYDQVVYDSDIERSFADQLEKNTAVKVYAKLPGWFAVPTPLGSYNPDWAVLVERDEGERLYFVVETKASLVSSDLRNAESAKIECGKAHFAALKVSESPAEYRTALSIDDVLASS